MKTLIIGATGAIGRDLLNVLLKDQDYTEIVLFVRRPVGLIHPKLSEILTDFDNPEAVSEFVDGDVLFSCLGTTLKAAGSKEKQWHIDFEIPVKFAELAKRNGVSQMVLLSAYGAASKSSVFYSRIKGQLEEKAGSLNFGKYIVFKPGVLLRKNTDRPAERFIADMLKFLNNFGLIRKFRPLSTLILAEKLAKAPKILRPGKHVIALEEIFGF